MRYDRALPALLFVSLACAEQTRAPSAPPEDGGAADAGPVGDGGASGAPDAGLDPRPRWWTLDTDATALRAVDGLDATEVWLVGGAGGDDGVLLRFDGSAVRSVARTTLPLAHLSVPRPGEAWVLDRDAPASLLRFRDGALIAMAPERVLQTPNDLWADPGATEAWAATDFGLGFYDETGYVSLRLEEERFMFSQGFDTVDGTARDNQWLGLEDRIYRHGPEGWTRPHDDASRPGDDRAGAWHISAHADATWAVSTSTAGEVQRWVDGAWAYFSIPGLQPSAARIWSGGPDHAWLVDPGGAWRFAAGAWRQVDLPDGAPAPVDMWAAGPEDVWIAGADGRVLRWVSEAGFGGGAAPLPGVTPPLTLTFEPVATPGSPEARVYDCTRAQQTVSFLTHEGVFQATEDSLQRVGDVGSMKRLAAPGAALSDLWALDGNVGLYRFDGVEWRPEGRLSQGLLRATSGGLFATELSSVYQLDLETGARARLQGGEPHTTSVVHDLWAASPSVLYIAKDNGAWRWETDGWTRLALGFAPGYTAVGGVNAEHVFLGRVDGAIDELVGGEVIAHRGLTDDRFTQIWATEGLAVARTRGDELWVYDGTRWIAADPTEAPSDITCITGRGVDDVWLGTRTGVVRMRTR